MPSSWPTNLVSTANQAFVNGMHWGVLVAAAATAVRRRHGRPLPAGPTPAARTTAEQQDEYAAEHAGEATMPADELTPVVD